jgi:hypothetical protein
LNTEQTELTAKTVRIQLRQDFLNLKFIDGVFVLMLADRSVQLAKDIKSILQERRSIWQFEIADDAMSRQLRIKATGKKKAAEAEAAAKEKARAAARDRAEQELIPVLKAEIHEMLKSNCNENTEIENTRFRVQIQSIIKEARNTFYLDSNKEIMSITKLKKGACSGRSTILDWCDLEYTQLTRTDDEGKETGYIKIKNLHNGEEQ